MSRASDTAIDTSCLRLHDYLIERRLLDMAEIQGGGTGLPLWRQHVQYAIGHTLNDYYTLAPEVRGQMPIRFLLERRWPLRTGCFPSLLHYWDVKNTVGDELVRIVSGDRAESLPFMLYEQWHVPVRELDMDLSIIFQLAWHSARQDRSLTIQKFMLCGNEDVACSFVHMANVFCRKAYGAPPEVEIGFLMEGEVRRYDCGQYPLEASLDYLKLLSSVQEEPGKPSSSHTESGNARGKRSEESGPRLLLM